MYVSFYEIDFFSREIIRIDRLRVIEKLFTVELSKGGSLILYCTQIA